MVVKEKSVFFEKIIILLVALMPLHSLVFDTLIKGSLDNLWRDITIILGLFYILLNSYKNRERIKMGSYGNIIIISTIIILIFAFVSDNVYFSLNVARTYILPMYVYFILINSSLKKDSMEKIIKVFIFGGVILTIYGIFQAFVLGDDFLISLGYEAIDGKIKNAGFYITGFIGVQRVNSTFVYPNACGVYFGINILLLSVRLKKQKINKYLMLILITGLITTFSRSAIIGTILGLIILHKNKIFNKSNFRFNSKIIVEIFIALLLLGIIDYFLLDSLVGRMIYSSIANTITFKDGSLLKHLEDLVIPIKTIVQNPFGLGFGKNGPFALSAFENSNLVESSVYLLVYEIGIFGAIVYLYPYIKEIIICKSNSNFISLSGAICVLVLFTYLLLPNVQIYEIIFYVYFFIGIKELIKISISQDLSKKLNKS